jgi:hypothetical protein
MDNNPPPSVATMAATMQAMQQELETLRQAATNGTTTAATVGATTSTVPTTGAILTDVAQTALPVSGVSLVKWIGMKLDSFDGSGCPVEAADWLTYVEDKMDVFEVAYGDRVRYGTQLLKGEAQIWWRGVQTSHSSSPSSLTWHVLVR